MTVEPAKFTSVIPTPARQYATAIVATANAVVSPFLIYGVGSRETLWGRSPYYKKHTGDWAPRLWTHDRMSQFPHVNVVGQRDGKFLVMPMDGLGWGRGLLQLDYAAEYSWLQSNDWRDPAVNILKGVDHLMSKFTFMNSTAPVIGVTDGKVVTVDTRFAARWKLPAGQYPDPRPFVGGVLEAAMVASYNAAKENVLRAIVAGGIAAVDRCTTPGRRGGLGDYSQDVRSRAISLQIRYQSA